ncbi:MAG TPA: hypothetical protein DHV84_07170 [Desulfotomaculum sp.]|nr:hypothetical protein [Desulfotomaculum sp.]
MVVMAMVAMEKGTVVSHHLGQGKSRHRKGAVASHHLNQVKLFHRLKFLKNHLKKSYLIPEVITVYIIGQEHFF